MKICLIFALVGIASQASDLPIVFVETVKKHEIFDRISYPARVVPKINATLLAEADGVIQKIYKPLGQSVKRGEEIIRLQHLDPVFSYAPLKATAPVEGVVSSLEVSEGSRVSRGDKLATVTNPANLRVVIEIAAVDLRDIPRGLMGEISVPGIEEPLRVKVTGISPYPDAATGTATAELSILEKPSPLLPGSVGRVDFNIRHHEGLEVPEDAILYRDKETFVRRIENEKEDKIAKQIKVSLGQNRLGFIEVLEGLKEGDQIVVRTNQYLANDEKVQIQTVKDKL